MFLEILKFIFSSFWIWAGTTIIIAIIAHGLTGILSVRIKKFVTDDTYKDEEIK